MFYIQNLSHDSYMHISKHNTGNEWMNMESIFLIKEYNNNVRMADIFFHSPTDLLECSPTLCY